MPLIIEGTMMGFRGAIGSKLLPFVVMYTIKLGHDDKLWVKVENGPTGYESASIQSLQENIGDPRPWAACMGTEGRWDRLEIPRSEIDKMLARLES